MVSIEKTIQEFMDAIANSNMEKLDNVLSDEVKILGSSGLRYGKKEIMEYFSHSTMPYATAWRAKKRALDPVAQLLLTLVIGIPVVPSSYITFSPAQLSP